MPANLVLTSTWRQEYYSHFLITVHNHHTLCKARDTKRQRTNSVPMNFHDRKRILSRQVKRAGTFFRFSIYTSAGRLHAQNRSYHNSANARGRSWDWARRRDASERQGEQSAIGSIRRTRGRQKFGLLSSYASGRCAGNEPIAGILDPVGHVARDGRVSGRFRALRPVPGASQTCSSRLTTRRRSRRKRLRKIYAVETCVLPKMPGPLRRSEPILSRS